MPRRKPTRKDVAPDPDAPRDPAAAPTPPPAGEVTDPGRTRTGPTALGLPADGPSASAAQPLPPLGRGWTQRYLQPVKYARSTFKDAMGGEHIAFRFDLPPGQKKPDELVLAVMRDHKYFKDGRPNGGAADAKTDPESYPTGLHFDHLPRGGKAWLIRDDAVGRAVADSIDDALAAVARKVEGGDGVGGPG